MSVNIKTNAADILQLIGAGVIPGFVMYKKFGRASEATKEVWSTVWDGNSGYPYTDVNLVDPFIVSDDPTDDQEIVIEAVDQDINFVTQTVTLNGTTPVPLTKAIMLPFRVEGMSADAINGQIDVKSGSTVYASITKGSEYGQSQMAIMAVPAGYYGMVTKIGHSVAGLNSGEINYRSKSFGEAWKTKRPFDIDSQVAVEDVDFFFDEKTILDVRVKPVANNTSVSAWFDLVLVEKARFHQLWGKPKRFKLGEVVFND